MTRWPDKVFIFEVNTWVWLDELSRQHGRAITLDTVPDDAIDALAQPNVDVIWLMGIWKRSEYARKNALRYKHEYVGALPDIRDDDVIGSAYSIAAYEVDARLGGRAGLAAFRQRLRDRGLRLILDFVPNHVAVDHPWITEQPDYIVHGKPKDRRERPSDFFRVKSARNGTLVLAHGRDPYFPGWSDTAQLNAFNPALRKAITTTLLDIASQCDGVRCDMAMLVMNDIFAHTWNGYVQRRPRQDFWPQIIPQVRAQYPNFVFIAEVYWGKEYDMLQQGFDFAYDKTLYDRVMEGNIEKLRAHLVAELDYQKRLVRFIENHDEPRAYERLGPLRSISAATLICTLPGACLLHQGQFTGRAVKLPVQIRRGPEETPRLPLYHYYLKLLAETRDPIYQTGQWYLFDLKPAGNSDSSHQNLLAYGWCEPGKDYRLIVVNLTPTASYARLPLKFWSHLADATWTLHDVIDGSSYERSGSEMTSPGLFIALKSFESHVFRFERREPAR